MEITDDIIKRKHKEFNARINAALSRKSSPQNGEQFSLAIQKLRQANQSRKPTSERPYGG